MLLWLLAYCAVMATIVGVMVSVRSTAMQSYGTRDAQVEWDAWRADAREMSEGQGPVKRRPPKSAEPPALVLMRDHFGVCLALALVLSSLLYGTAMFFLRGIVSSGGKFGPSTRPGSPGPKKAT
ncbi:MAG: hypothetical protein MUF06_01170 [Pirellulaceae bacterium]|jgi:hypothetical protein|nr:hypothetical protein [Pirellulaceae bacterium]